MSTYRTYVNTTQTTNQTPRQHSFYKLPTIIWKGGLAFFKFGGLRGLQIWTYLASKSISLREYRPLASALANSERTVW
jgi:hypothetical protein